MRGLILGMALVCVGLGCGEGHAGSKAKKEPVKWTTRSDKFLSCLEQNSSKAGDGEGDFIQYKCTSQFGPPMWMLIQEGVRYSFGFGTKQNTPQMAVGDVESPVEWWGTAQKGKFVPRTVIKRFEFSDFGEPEKRTKQLVVFRLLKNGKSCVLAVVASSQTENSDARKVAFGQVKCLE